MRNLCIAAIAAGLILAPAAWAGPLSPGQPAGVHGAQHEGGTAMYLIGGAVLAAAIAIAVSNGSGPSTMTTAPVSSTTTLTSSTS